MKPKRKPNKKDYSDVQKLEVIQLANKIGRNKAAEQTGVPPSNITAWKKQYEVIEKNATEYMQKSDEGMIKLMPTKQEILDQHEVSFTEKAIEFENKTIEKLLDLVLKADKPDHIHSVAGALKIVRETLRPKSQDLNVQVNNFNQFIDSISDKYKEL